MGFCLLFVFWGLLLMVSFSTGSVEPSEQLGREKRWGSGRQKVETVDRKSFLFQSIF